MFVKMLLMLMLLVIFFFFCSYFFIFDSFRGTIAMQKFTGKIQTNQNQMGENEKYAKKQSHVQFILN